MDWKTLLAPFVGAAAGWLASHGLTLTPDQQAGVVAMASGALTALAHWWDTRTPTVTPPSSGTGKQGGFARPEMLVAAIILAILAACAQLGLAPAQSFDEKLAYAYGTHTAVEQAAASAVNAHALTATEGQAVLNLGDQARALLDAAKAVETTNTTGATNDLTLAAAILAQLQTYLQARGVK